MKMGACRAVVPVLVSVLAATAACWPGPACAQQRSPGAEWLPLPGERLQQLRGGFDLPSGLVVAFGIERAAYVNGALVANTRLNVPDLTNMTPGQAQQLQHMTRPLVIQTGPGNRFDVAAALGAGTVIQNTLDGQHVRTLTTIDVEVGSLGLFQDLNSLSTLHNALIVAPGGP